MATASRRTSQQVTLLMLVLASITVLTLDYHGEASRGIDHVRNGVRDVLSPFQRGIAAVLHPVGQAAAGAFHYGSLQQENRRLADELGVANQQLAEARFERDGYLAALSLANLPFAANIPTVPAEVISGPTSNFDETVELGAGTSSGIGPGMPVVARAGLVGTVISASATTATVELLTAPKSQVPAVTLAGANFQVGGSGAHRPLLLVSNGTGQPAVSPNQVVYTSALALGAYPAGIPVAVVSSVHQSTGGVSEQIEATPLVDLDSLQYVTVLQWLPPA